jgi:hypothetical protein
LAAAGRGMDATRSGETHPTAQRRTEKMTQVIPGIAANADHALQKKYFYFRSKQWRR